MPLVYAYGRSAGELIPGLLRDDLVTGPRVLRAELGRIRLALAARPSP